MLFFLLVIILAPLILGPLLVLRSYRCVLPQIIPMDEDATYAPHRFQHYVLSQERELSPLGFNLVDCTVELTGTPRIRYTAVFERQDQKDLAFATMGFDLDPYLSPRKHAYTEMDIISRVQGGVWVVTSDAAALRPGSYRVQRFHAGCQPLRRLLYIHQLHVGERSRLASAGIPRDRDYAAIVQESLATQEIYDALARRDLIQDEETGEIKPTLSGALLIGWRHFGILAWANQFFRRLSMINTTLRPEKLDEASPAKCAEINQI